MDFLTPIEDSVIARLEQKTAKRVLVQPYPDNPEIYEPTHPVGALLVRYDSGEYSDTKDTGIVLQDRDMLWEITLAMWSLRGKGAGQGLYSYIEATRIALTGWRPPNCLLKMTPVDEGYVNRAAYGLKNKAQRLWQYQITFRTRVMNIETVEEEQGPLLTRLTAINASTNHTLEVPEE